MNKKLEAKDNVISKQLGTGWSLEKLIDEAYLSSLARLPSDAEKGKMLATLQASPEAERRTVVEDLYWALLSSKEFLFNH